MDRATSTAGVAERATPQEAARKRAAVELIHRHESILRRTARRYSLCAEDAEDAFQRAFEILLTKAPTVDPRELIRWMQTVTKHEAMAVRRNRERILGGPRPAAADDDFAPDWVQLIPSERAGPADQVERREQIARSREALQALKPHELRALTLLAEGYSYAEIGELTGWSRTKINRCLAEGRARYRSLITSSEEGGRCDELGVALSAFCDGETDEKEAATLREHLRACARCRATVRAYRAAPPAAAALAPVYLEPSLTERLHSALGAVAARFPGRTGAAEAAAQVSAGGGTRGAGMTVLAKVLAACVGTAGGAACVAAGVIPGPADLVASQERAPAIERSADPETRTELVTDEPVQVPAPAPAEPAVSPPPAPDPVPASEPPPPSPPPAVEFSPEAAAPAPVTAPAPSASSAAAAPGGSSGGGSPGGGAGEFGP